MRKPAKLPVPGLSTEGDGEENVPRSLAFLAASAKNAEDLNKATVVETLEIIALGLEEVLNNRRNRISPPDRQMVKIMIDCAKDCQKSLLPDVGT